MIKITAEPQPYFFDGLVGRKIYVPSRKQSTKKFLIVYGQHVSIERLRPMIAFLSNYGDIYLFDSPGFGNMEPSYKLGKKPTLDFYSSNLKNIFDNELPKSEKFQIVAISFGMQIITHFMQKYPEYYKRVSVIISFVGFIHHSELNLPKGSKWLFKYVLGGLGQTSLGSKLYRYILFQPVLLIPIHLALTPLMKPLKRAKFKTRWKYASEQAWLWKYNDPRTHAYTGWQFLNHVDLTNKRINLDCHHIFAEHDQYIKNNLVLSHFKKVFLSVTAHALNIPSHSPIDIEEEYEIAELLPKNVIELIEAETNLI
ncbi:MAG: hypothetical protein M3Q14_02755 [bacterium]|nr:hypothetical protein [bacterium]